MIDYTLIALTLLFAGIGLIIASRSIASRRYRGMTKIKYIKTVDDE